MVCVRAEQLSTVKPKLGHKACERVKGCCGQCSRKLHGAGKATKQPRILEQAMELLVKDTERTELMLNCIFCRCVSTDPLTQIP